MTVIDTIKDKLHHHHHDKHAAATQTQTTPTPVSRETETETETGTSKNVPDASDADAPAVSFSDTPVFHANKITVIFVLGGPGAGTFRLCRWGKSKERERGRS